MAGASASEAFAGSDESYGIPKFHPIEPAPPKKVVDVGPSAPIPPKRPSEWIWWAVAVGGLATLAGVIWYLWR